MTANGWSRWARRNEVLAGVLLALGLAAALAVGLWWWLFRTPTWPAAGGAWLLATSLTAFAAYGYDKRQARNGGRRIPEAALHALALAGGSPGAYAGMRTFRHKTLKGRFRVVFWSVAAVQAAVLVGVVKGMVFG
jgi:uncharacterized membrane protein YsdA (DUF1294 family)